MPAPLWSIVLAGGAGRRLATVTGGTPKQFWSSDGGPSLVEQTAGRLATLIPASRTVTVVDRTHRRFINALGDSRRLGDVVYQPADRGTAAGVLLGLAAVVAAAPDALVLLTPADHGVARPDLFSAGVRQATAWIEADRNEVVLFGVPPSAALGDYGWISPGVRPGSAGADVPRPVATFVEKPAPQDAARLMASGAVWNTMVLVARAAALLNLYRQHLPELATLCADAMRAPPPARDALLSARYATLTPADFSHDLLAHAHGLAVHVWPADIGWSDLGTPDRLEAWRTADQFRISA